MTISQTFELLPILALLNEEMYLEVKQEDVHAIIRHVVGEKLDEEQCEAMKDTVNRHIAEHYPRLLEAAGIVAMNKHFTEKHYMTCINLYRKNHSLQQMEKAEA